MAKNIARAAVIGSGVMGAAIAAHLANVGITTLLLDIVPTSLTPEERAKGLTLEHPSVRTRFAAEAIAKLARTQPAPLYVESFAGRITPGNIEDDLRKIKDVDWVIEICRQRRNFLEK
jgi:3-hydroxyacyl-CoA dehydrogenase